MVDRSNHESKHPRPDRERRRPMPRASARAASSGELPRSVEHGRPTRRASVSTPLGAATSIASIISALVVASCSSDAPSGASAVDAGGGTGLVLCDAADACPEGLACVSGVCEAASADAGAASGRLVLCTPEGCAEPYRVTFGGSRVGVETRVTLTLRSIGTLPVHLRNLDLLGTAAEFSVEPRGEVDVTLAPNDELAIRVGHTAMDGVADEAKLQIISDADRSRLLVDLRTEYKGVPALSVSLDPAEGQNDVTVLDFGNVRAGRRETRRLYLKNRDRVIDGSVLAVEEVRTEPQTSTRFAVSLDAPLPAYLNQFNALCATDAACTDGDRCGTAGVCRTSDGRLRDVLTASVTLSAASAGQLEESILIQSNDGGARMVRTVLLRARVTESQLAVTPDPIEFPEAFVGFTSTRHVTIGNGGSAPLVIEALRLGGGAELALDLGGTALPATIMPREAIAVDVAFTPAAVGSLRGALTILSDDARARTTTVSITGEARVAPELSLSTSRIDFGPTHIGANATMVVTARNAGGSELRVPSLVTSATTAREFSVDPASLPPLAPGASATFNVRFNPPVPSHPTTLEGAVELVSNDPRRRPVARIGIAGVAVNPTALVVPSGQVDFNQLSQNANAPRLYEGQRVATTMQLFNTGVGALTVASIALANDARHAFTVSGASAPFALASGQSAALELTYTAGAAGGDAATLTLATNDLDLPGGLVSIGLLGSTSPCPVRANAAGHADASGRCTYACVPGFWDLNGDRDAASSNGCEHGPCTVTGPDAPDDAFEDANCDGIDGDPAHAVFVAPPPLGNDANPGTMAQPKATIANAISAARGRALYLGAGAYAGPVEVSNGVSIYGGYDPSSGWRRSASNVSSIISTEPVAVRAAGITQPTVLDRLTIVAGNATTPGGSSIGIHVLGASRALEIRNSSINAGAGARGLDGTRGTRGEDGSDGEVGETGCDGCGGLGGGGRGASSACSAAGGDGGHGGYGGGNQGGTAGFPEGRGGMLGEAAQGCAGSCSGCNGHTLGWTGGDGDPGRDGTPGPDGPGGASSGTIVGGMWVGSPGRDGSRGASAMGGAGGGGGGAGVSSCYAKVPLVNICEAASVCKDDRGGGGGGGGAGGCGGNGGTGGTGGGGSFGVFLVDAAPILVGNTIVTASGGIGGAGGGPGEGGAPGHGAVGGAKQDDSGAGGRGGDGGNGGPGGGGGGGGGGVSFCVYRVNSSDTAVTAMTCSPGPGGAGGSGGTGNPQAHGATGDSGAIY